MRLTKNFTLEELTVTNVSAENDPSTIQIESLQRLADNVLQPLRDSFGLPIRINSGFRSLVVNKKVGGSPTSSHCKGEAADLDSDDNARLFEIIRSELPFDQLIWEGGDDHQPAWVHVSYREGNNRRQVLRMTNGQYTAL